MYTKRLTRWFISLLYNKNMKMLITLLQKIYKKLSKLVQMCGRTGPSGWTRGFAHQSSFDCGCCCCSVSTYHTNISIDSYVCKTYGSFEIIIISWTIWCVQTKRWSRWGSSGCIRGAIQWKRDHRSRYKRIYIQTGTYTYLLFLSFWFKMFPS